MDAPHYSTQAIEGLHDQAISLSSVMPRGAQNMERIVQLLRQAIKFQLPDNGDLFEDGLRALPAVFRLPYPVITAEFRIAKDAPQSQQPLAARGEELLTSTRRIALAIEINTGNFDAYSWMLPQEKYDLLTSDGAIAVIPVFYVDASSHWAIPPYGVVIPARKSLGTPAMAATTAEIYGEKVPAEMKRLPLEMHPTFLLPEYAHELEATESTNHVLATVAQDNHDESRAILNLIEILSCKNVTTETISAPKALNKKREAKGKTPIFEYKVLMLDLPDERAKSAQSSGGTHASPRIHLRRGHIRRLPNKNVWVNAAVVGNRKTGVIVKDYSIPKPSK